MKILHVPKLERNLISERQVSLMSGLLFVKSPTVAHLETRKDVCCDSSYSPSSGLYEMMASRRRSTPQRAFATRAPPQCDIMEVHRLLAQPSEYIIRASAKATGIIITGEWRPCVECDQSKALRHTVPRTTDNRASERAALLYMDLAGPMESESAGGSRYVMKIVDNFSRFKVSKFPKTRSSVETAAALKSYIASYITPEQVSIRAVRTDHGDEFNGEFQQKLDQLGIQHQHMPPVIPKYDGAAERWIGLLREKPIALLSDLEKLAAGLRKDKYWAEAWNYSIDVTNMCATTSKANGITPYQMWYTRSPPKPAAPLWHGGLLQKGQKRAQLGAGKEMCLMMDIAQDYLSRTFRVVNVSTGEVAIRQSPINGRRRETRKRRTTLRLHLV